MRFPFFRDNLDSILSTFTEAETRLGKFIDQQDAKANTAAMQIDALQTRRNTAIENIGKARRTRAKIAELIS